MTLNVVNRDQVSLNNTKFKLRLSLKKSTSMLNNYVVKEIYCKIIAVMTNLLNN